MKAPAPHDVAAWWPHTRSPAPPVPAPPAAPPLAADEIDRHRVRLVALDRHTGAAALHAFAALPRLLTAGDLVVVNDAATLPASLPGQTEAGEIFELRLSAPVEGERLVGVLFGAGDWRTRTEDRPPPPRVLAGQRVTVGPLAATVAAARGRQVELDVDVGVGVDAGGAGGRDPAARRDALWQALYASAAPVQYAHRRDPLALWAVQTAYAARPWAVEMPSAGRPLTWEILLELRRRGIGVAALTHAAGLASTGDAALDAALPWPERYEVPERTAAAVAAARAAGRRVIAVGTTVVRALEASGGRAGAGVASLVLGPATRPRVADGLVTGLHVPGESHYELLRAFAPEAQLERVLGCARAAGLSGHELGDACLIY
ncbi:MAG TPA: S-adenosylmethionine:tRNA ribosyltransferase-isomerase [Kofleriaceae bacterium]|nr:S-adenosylmethionine:tRNA ribosyltransferase-isomerase [Kofleriaceae bacterium]